MKERPILFSAPMVRAILDGRKSQTRRIVKPQPFLCPKWGITWEPKGHASNKPSYCERNVNWNPITKSVLDFYRDRGGSPYGQPGDRLWVKETWCCSMDSGEFVYRPEDGHHACLYRATTEHEVIKDDGDGGIAYRKDGTQASPWVSSLYMPRWASRITLEVTAVRVERLQEISEEDALAEGFERREHFIRLWDELNQERGFGFDANPWVWVIEFRRIKP